MFDINAHSGKELHQFKLYGIQLILNVLGNDNLVDKVFAYVLTDIVWIFMLDTPLESIVLDFGFSG